MKHLLYTLSFLSMAIFMSFTYLPVSQTVKTENQSIELFPIDTLKSPEALAQEQLDAYNNRDIEAFLRPYSDSVEVYTFPNQLNYKGKDRMRMGYASFFKSTPDLHCELVNRIVIGNTVIDREKVTGIASRPELHAVAIYKIKDGKIAQVYFISE